MSDNFDRVSERISAAVIGFYTARLEQHREFYASDLVRYVHQAVGLVAPDSPGRVLRDLRKRGALNYQVLSRRDSLYRFLPVEAPRAFIADDKGQGLMFEALT